MKKYSMLIVMLTLFIVLAGCSTSQTDDNPISVDTQDDPINEEIVEEIVTETREFDEIDLSSHDIDQVYDSSLLSADGNWLLVNGRSNEQNLSKLFLINNSTGVTKVIDEGEHFIHHDISSNGDLILYTKYEDSDATLYLYYSGQITTLSSNRGKGTISPDSSKIAYTEYEKGLFIYDIATGSSQLLSEEKEAWNPIWFPDNKHLFYFTDLGQTLTDGAGQLQGLAKINIETKEKEQITDDTGKYRSASWIKPGEVLHVFSGWDDAFNNAIVDIPTNTYLDLGEEDLYFLGGNASVNQKKELFYLNDTEKVLIYDGITLIDEIAIIDGNNSYKYMSFSPDGEKMAYLSGDIYAENSTGRDIWIAEANGENARKITNTSGYYFDPIWIDDETVIAIENSEDNFIIKYIDITE